jgi:hypothetical protein
MIEGSIRSVGKLAADGIRGLFSTWWSGLLTVGSLVALIWFWVAGFDVLSDATSEGRTVSIKKSSAVGFAEAQETVPKFVVLTVDTTMDATRAVFGGFKGMAKDNGVGSSKSVSSARSGSSRR